MIRKRAPAAAQGSAFAVCFLLKGPLVHSKDHEPSSASPPVCRHSYESAQSLDFLAYSAAYIPWSHSRNSSGAALDAGGGS